MPKKYERVVEDRHILNSTKKRLTNEERWILEIELLRYNLKMNEPIIFNMIKKSKPDFTQIIKTKTFDYSELVFKNKVRVKVPSEIHLLSINSKEPIFRNY